MANFLTVKDTPDVEFIVNVDKIEALKKTPTNCFMYMGGEVWYLTEEEYKKIRQRILDPFNRNHTT